MSILYAISVVSFCVLVWAAFAIARHVRKASAEVTSRSEATPLAPSSNQDSHRKAS